MLPVQPYSTLLLTIERLPIRLKFLLKTYLHMAASPGIESEEDKCHRTAVKPN